MNITKKHIGSLVSDKLNINNDQGLEIVNSFFQILKKELPKHDIKLSKFGVFYSKKQNQELAEILKQWMLIKYHL